jgi:hypothetical protein
MSDKLKSIGEPHHAPAVVQMVIQPELVMECDGADIFLRFDGKVIAKRGYPHTPHAMTWISLEPGVVVRDARRKGQRDFIVKIDGARVH